MALSWLVCEKCGKPMFVQRKRGRQRKRGHVKTMWCPWCEEVTKHRERY